MRWFAGILSLKIRIVCLMVLGLLIISSQVSAKQWGIQEGLLDEEDLEVIRQKFPSIISPSQSQSLLEEIGRRRPMDWLRIQRDPSGQLVVTGKPASVLKEIAISTPTRALKNALGEQVSSFIGQVDSEELRKSLYQRVNFYLDKKGFPNPTIKFDTRPEGPDVVYTLEIDEGFPCIIRNLNFERPLPKAVRRPRMVGKVCDGEAIKEAIDELTEDLYDIGYKQARFQVSTISMDAQGIADVSITGQAGKRVRYEIRSSDKSKISEIFTRDELESIDPNIIGPESMVNEIARKYRIIGFDDVQVGTPKIVRQADDWIVYRYKVEPGKQYVVTGITFEGLNAYSREDALEAMNFNQDITDTSLDLVAVPLVEIFGIKRLVDVYPALNRDDLNAGVDKLKSKYRKDGYWKVKVRQPRLVKDEEKGTVQVIVSVDEGKKRLFHKLMINGNDFIEEGDIRDLLDLSEGEPMSREALDLFQRELRNAYTSDGFLYLEIRISLVSIPRGDELRTSIVVDINENSRVKIGSIHIRGLNRTRKVTVRRELLFATGDYYNRERINQSRRNLSDLGLFRSVQIRPSTSSLIEKSDTLDMDIELRETKPGRIVFGPGFSFDQGLRYSLEGFYSNLGGVGRQVSLRTTFSEEVNQKAISRKTLLGRSVSLGYLEPYLFELPVNGSISTLSRARAREIWEISNSWEVALIHKLRYIFPGAVASTFLGFKINREEGSSVQETNLTATGNIRISEFGFRYSYDTRNNRSWPSSGYTLDIEASWARYELGGDMRYFKWELGNNYFVGLHPDWTAAFGYNLVSFEGIEREGLDTRGDVLPASERVHAGGPETVRGYELRKLGPLVQFPDEDTCAFQTSQLGGTRKVVLKLEMRYRLSDWSGLTTFVDSGNVFLSNREVNKFSRFYQVQDTGCPGAKTVEDNQYYEFEDLLSNPEYIYKKHYTTYGLAFNLLTPIGAINLAYGIPWLEPETQDCKNDRSRCFPRADFSESWYERGRFHVNVGTRF